MKKGSQRGPKMTSKSHQILSRKHPQKTMKKSDQKDRLSGTPRPANHRLLPVAGGVPFSRIQRQVSATVQNNRGKKAEA